MSGSTLVLNSDASPLGLLPISIMNWQTAIKSIYIDTVQVIHSYENWFVRSPSVTFNVPSVIMTKTFMTANRKVKFSKDNVKLRDNYTCQYCNKKFFNHELTVDHVIPRMHGGKSIFSNLVASCRKCNENKGAKSDIKPIIIPYKPSYYELVEKRKQYFITVPHESWLDYLQWPADKIQVSPNFRKDFTTINLTSDGQIDYS